MSNDPLFFFEQTDFSLRFARCAISETSLHIEELKEVLATEAASLGSLVPPGTQVVCAMRPKPRALHLATADEAKRYPGMPGLQEFARNPLFAKNDPAWFAGVQASDGGPVGANPWLLSVASAVAYDQARAAFESIKLKPARCLDGTLATVGAITSTVSGPTLFIEVGEFASQALLIGPEGVVAARAVSLNLDQIAEAVQGELNLKFRGSAAKLFFNPDCDFSETGAKVAARVGTALKADLVPLLANQPAPVAFSCTGLPILQQWLETQLAAVLGLSVHVPDVKAWSNAVGVTFGNPSLTAAVPAGWFNFLHFINSQTLESPVAVPWQAEILSLKTPIAKTATTPPVSTAPRPNKPATAPAVASAAAVAATPAAAPKATAPSAPAAPVAPASPAPAAAAKAPAAATPTKAMTGAKPAAPAPAKAVAATPAKVAAATPPAKAATPAQPAAAPAKAASSVQYSAKPASAGTAAPMRRDEKKNKTPLFIGIAVGILLLAAGGFFYIQSQNEEKERIAAEKVKAEQRVKAEEERARLAEQKAKEEAETRKRFEFETSQKLAAAETARKQAEEEARTQAANRLANARGTVLVTTQPAGATVTLGDLPARKSPATFDYVKIGKYPVTITLPHYEEVKLEVEVTENNTTDTGTVTLASLVGAVAITSEPSGSSFELRPANSFMVSADAKKTGQTPATLNDLDPGEYAITFTRAGWAPHTETVTVARDTTVQAKWTFPSGTVKITSTPAGATVTQDGNKLGVTPLTLRQPPGAVRYELKLAFHDPVTLPAQVEEGKTLELNAQLAATDIVFGPAELDKNPEPINPKTPDLPSSLTLVEGRVVIQMTINRDGTPTDLKIVRASNAEIGKIYLAALAKWKFKPGMKDGKAVRSAVVVPFLINPSKD